mgnify:CR=1 FL=1
MSEPTITTDRPYELLFALSRDRNGSKEWYSFLDNVFHPRIYSHCLVGSLTLASERAESLGIRGVDVFTLVPGEVDNPEEQADRRRSGLKGAIL